MKVSAQHTSEEPPCVSNPSFNDCWGTGLLHGLNEGPLTVGLDLRTLQAHTGMMEEDPMLGNGSTKSGVTPTLAWGIDYSPLANEISASPWFWKVKSCLIYVDELMWGWTRVQCATSSYSQQYRPPHAAAAVSSPPDSAKCRRVPPELIWDRRWNWWVLFPLYSCGSVTFTEGLAELLVQPLSASIPLPASLPIRPLIATLPCLPCLHGVIGS